MSGNISNCQLAEHTWQEISRLKGQIRVAILPVGSCEAHGPHLPLNTDTLIAQEASVRAANLLNSRGVGTVVLPTLTYGVTQFGVPFPGTVTISREAVRITIRDICASLAAHGIELICISNHHLEPAHFQTVREGAAEAMGIAPIKVIAPDKREERWANTLTEEFRRGSRHAGSYETSAVLAIRPDLVREEERRELEPLWIDLPKKIRDGATNFIEAGSPMAYFGDPAKASREEGEFILSALANMLATSVVEALEGRS